jgi:hypothetical protein
MKGNEMQTKKKHAHQTAALIKKLRGQASAWSTAGFTGI